MSTEKFDRDSWERRWAKALHEHRDVVARRPPSAHLLTETGDQAAKLADTMLIARGKRDGALVEFSFSGCTRRGLTNGRTTSQLTIPMLEAIMDPLGVGFAYSPQGLE